MNNYSRILFGLLVVILLVSILDVLPNTPTQESTLTMLMCFLSVVFLWMVILRLWVQEFGPVMKVVGFFERAPTFWAIITLSIIVTNAVLEWSAILFFVMIPIAMIPWTIAIGRVMDELTDNAE